LTGVIFSAGRAPKGNQVAGYSVVAVAPPGYPLPPPSPPLR